MSFVQTPALFHAWRRFLKMLRGGWHVEAGYSRLSRVIQQCPKFSEQQQRQLLSIVDDIVDRRGHTGTFGQPESVLVGYHYGLPGLRYLYSYDSDLLFHVPEIQTATLFDQALRFVLRWEGGYSDHPNDPGGETNFGITQAVYYRWRIKNNLPVRSVKQIEENEVFSIYRDDYWSVSKCPSLINYDELALVHFDTAINMGPVRAAKILQESVDVVQDGRIGNITLGAVRRDCKISAVPVMRRYCDIRERVYRWIAKNNDGAEVFLKGWMNRLNALREEIGLTAPPDGPRPEIIKDTPMGHLLDLELDGSLEGEIVG